MELTEQSIILLIALFKVYDNYITSLNTRVKCWKVKKKDVPNLFILGMSILEFSGKYHYVAFVIPMKYWKNFNIIELHNEPPDFKWADYNEIKERLLGL